MARFSRNPGKDAPHDRESFVKRHLDPTERLGEVLFGLIMVLTIALGEGLVVGEGDDATKRLLLGILGCNLAWGVIDGGMYVMTCMFDRGLKARLLLSLQKAANEADALVNGLDAEYALKHGQLTKIAQIEPVGH